jgi:hypothetical protein
MALQNDPSSSPHLPFPSPDDDDYRLLARGGELGRDHNNQHRNYEDDDFSHEKYFLKIV